MTQTATMEAPTNTTVMAPLVLTPPEVVQPVVPAQAKGAVRLPDGLRSQVDAQLDAFIHGLKTADVTSDDFRSRLDQAFAVGRKEIADATAVSNGFTKRNFAGEAETPAYQAISQMRTLFDELNPANQGDLFSPTKILGIPVPFGNKLQSYLRRYESADAQLSAIYENVVSAKDEVGRGVSELGLVQQKLWTGLEKLEAAVYFITRLDERLSADIDAIRASEPDRARALEQEVLYYVRQNAGDVLAAQALTVNAYNVAGELRKTGRETMNGCDRVATLGMASLSVAVTLARATGVQIKTQQMLEGAKKSIEGLIGATGTALQNHVKATTEFSSNPLLGVQTLQNMFDQTYAAMDTLEKFRQESLNTMATNNAMMRTQLDTQMTRLKNDRSAASGDFSSAQPVGGIALA